MTHWGLWPFLRGRPRVRISPVSLAPKPGDFCLIFDAILTPKTNYGPITLIQRGRGYLKWPQLPGASLRAVISGVGWGGGKDWGYPWHEAALAPLFAKAGGDIPSRPIPSYPPLSRPIPAAPLGSAEAKQRLGSPPLCPRCLPQPCVTGWGQPRGAP